MHIAYVGNFHNFGHSAANTTTAMVYLMSELKEVESIDVFCAYPNTNIEETFIPDKVKIIPLFNAKNPLSTINLYRIKWKKYDTVIFNILPTVFGKSSLLNMIGLISPYILKKLGNRNIRVVYHNSTFTNDIEKLGYNSPTDRIRKIILSMVEMRMFTSLPVYMPLKIYVNKILDINNKALVKYIDMRYFEAIPTIYINSFTRNKFIERGKNPNKTILLHGYWGPQKNLEFALENLMKLRNAGIKFHLILSGCVNSNFPAYVAHFNQLVKKYSMVIDERLGYISEKNIMKLFLFSDLVVIPYNVPGGHSGVLETAIFFDTQVICINHPEFAEQASGLNGVILTDPYHFYNNLKIYLEREHDRTRNTFIDISQKIVLATESVRQLLN
jgi:glycosyltransferase involved in cell wall biosynthesis